uniref:Uncharacterized protein n=1 Tax=Rhizophora mucronata TaxID=61149 RepID=A0A2P2PAX8_RHIMU
MTQATEFTPLILSTKGPHILVLWNQKLELECMRTIFPLIETH